MSARDFDDFWQIIPPKGEGPDGHAALNLGLIGGIAPLGQRPGEDPALAVPPPLQTPLFGGDLNTYALLDAAKIPSLAEILETSRLDHICLFRGERDRIGQAAPWLVRLEDRGKFTRNLFRQSPRSWHLWGRDCCVFIRSEAPLDALYAHFRRFTRLRDHRGRWVFFRFWDPLVAGHYFARMRHDPARIGRFFRLPSGQSLRLLAQTGPDKMLEMAPDPGLLRPAGNMPDFNESDAAAMADIAWLALTRQLSGWLALEYPDRLADRPTADLQAISRHVVAAGRRAGLTMREEFAFLAQMMMTSGGWFWDDRYPAALCRLIGDTPSPKAQALADAYAGIQSQTPQAELLSQWPELRAHLAALPDADAVTPDSFSQIAARFLPKTGAGLAEAIASTRARLRATGLADQRIEGRAMVLTLIYGPRFFEDPFKPWANLPPEAAIAAAWQEITQ